MGALDQNYVVQMKPAEFKSYFKNLPISQSGVKNPADVLFKQLMDEVAGH